MGLPSKSEAKLFLIFKGVYWEGVWVNHIYPPVSPKWHLSQYLHCLHYSSSIFMFLVVLIKSIKYRAKSALLYIHFWQKPKPPKGIATLLISGFTKRLTCVSGCWDQPSCYAHVWAQWLHMPKELPREQTGKLSECQSADAEAVRSCILNPRHLLGVHHTMHSWSWEF